MLRFALSVIALSIATSGCAGADTPVSPPTTPLITSGTVLASVATTVPARGYSVSVVARSAANGQITGSTTLTITVIAAQ